MKNIIILLVSSILFSFPNLVCSQSYLDEEEVEDTWTVSVERYGDSISDWVVVASVNGKVTHGDRLRVRIPIKTIERCSIGNTMTTFYTTNIDNEAEDQFLEGVMIPAKLNNIDIYVDGALAIADFEFETATPVLQLPTNFTVGIAAAGDETILAEFPFELGVGGSCDRYSWKH